jgi:hypothetical protein
VLVQILNEYVQERRTAHMLRRVISGEINSPGYFRLSPYSRKDELEFSRADLAHIHVRDWIEDARHPILILTGISGTGKSSLLAASVAPEFTKRDWLVVIVRSLDNPEIALHAALVASHLARRSAPQHTDLLHSIRLAAQPEFAVGRHIWACPAQPPY